MILHNNEALQCNAKYPISGMVQYDPTSHRRGVVEVDLFEPCTTAVDTVSQNFTYTHHHHHSFPLLDCFFVVRITHD